MAKRASIIFILLLTIHLKLLVTGCDAQPDSSKVILNITGPNLSFLQRQSTYTITLTNEKKQVLKNARLECAIPEYLQYVSAAPRGHFTSLQSKDSTVIEWNIGDIKPQEQKKIELVLKSNDIGKYEFSAKLIDGFFEHGTKVELSASQKITILGVAAIHISTYDTEDPVEVGDNTTFVMEMRNEGTLLCTNIVLVNLIDSKMKFVAAKGPVGYSAAGNKIKFEPIPQLEPGEKATYKIVCTAIKEGSSKNTASLKYDQFSNEILDQEGTGIYK